MNFDLSMCTSMTPMSRKAIFVAACNLCVSRRQFVRFTCYLKTCLASCSKRKYLHRSSLKKWPFKILICQKGLSIGRLVDT